MTLDPDWAAEATQIRRIGAYTGGELQIEIWPANNNAVGRIPILFFHGFSLITNPCQIVAGEPYWDRLATIAAVTGSPVVAADFGGNTWANTTARTLVATMRTYLGTLGLRTDKFFASGESMGSLLAMLMAWTDPVACVGYWVRASIVAAQTFHDANPGGLASSMEAAYTNLAGLVAAYPTMDPSNATNRTKLATFGQRGRIDWTDEDEFIDPSIPAAYAPQVGAIGVQRHGDHAANLYTPTLEVAEWIRGVIDTYA